MDPITITADLASQLAEVHSPVELRDPNGNKVGRFVPILDLTGWEPLSPGITEEERKRRKESTEPRLTTEQILAHLEELNVSRRMDANRG